MEDNGKEMDHGVNNLGGVKKAKMTAEGVENKQ